MIDDIDITRARAFGRAHKLGALSRKPFAWRVLARGEQVDISDDDPELPPHCKQAFFYRRVNGRVSAILALHVAARDIAECKQFAAQHGLAIEQPADWPGAVLWTRSPAAIERERVERARELARVQEQEWRAIAKKRLKQAAQ